MSSSSITSMCPQYGQESTLSNVTNLDKNHTFDSEKRTKAINNNKNIMYITVRGIKGRIQTKITIKTRKKN